MASEYGHIETVQVLLDYGADINSQNRVRVVYIQERIRVRGGVRACNYGFCLVKRNPASTPFRVFTNDRSYNQVLPSLGYVVLHNSRKPQRASCYSPRIYRQDGKLHSLNSSSSLLCTLDTSDVAAV